MKVKTRESNIEALRIISMLFIILFHYVANCNFQYTNLSLNNLMIKTILFFGELGVNLFILITGYYLCESKMSLKKLVLIIGEVFFYNLLNYFIGYKIGYINSLNDLKILFPVITGYYWFITGYILVYILSPYFNKLISIFSKREYQKFLLITLTIWCIIPTVLGFFYNSSERLLYFNGFIWLSLMYFIGAYIRKYNIKSLNTKKKSIITCGITFLIMILSICIIDSFKETFLRIGTTETAYFRSPNNLLMIILSISCFMFFKNLSIKRNIIINKIASTTLGIYLFHEGVLKKYIWGTLFKSNIYIYTNSWFLYALSATVIIFFIGLVIDLIRQFLEKILFKKIIELRIWHDMYNETKRIGLKFIDRII